jgi:hypothetical protein
MLVALLLLALGCGCGKNVTKAAAPPVKASQPPDPPQR